METPIYDFAKAYAASGDTRAHMPGHKGTKLLGPEPLDLTEIAGADSLFEADGIIKLSERNATALFGSYETMYSTEGSSLCIRTMLALALYELRQRTTERPVVIAARNAHKVFLQTAALLDFDIVWLWDESDSFSLCRADVTPSQLTRALDRCSEEARPVAAVYVTSPDYLGNEVDVAALAETAHRYGAPFLVDNAHGAYLRFLPEDRHPLTLGADLVCDSAHKTFPVLTGGAYLHISQNAPASFVTMAKDTMALFASTSPSYLILESLDLNNRTLAEGYSKQLTSFLKKLDVLKLLLGTMGWEVLNTDPLKLTLDPRSKGLSGLELAAQMEEQKIHVEYADPDYVVLMLTPQNNAMDLFRLEHVLRKLSPEETPAVPLSGTRPLWMPHPAVRMTPREATFAPRERIAVEEAVGRILAVATTGCPPAVPAVVSGEEISEEAVKVLQAYGTDHVWVVTE